MSLRGCRLLHESTELGVVLQHRSSSAIVVAEGDQSLANTVQAKLKVGLGGLVIGMRLLADLVHLRLLLGKRGLEDLNFLLQLRRPGAGLVNSRSLPCNVLLELALLGLGLGHLLVAVSLFSCLSTCLLLELGDHVLDETLPLAERIAAGRAEPQHRGNSRCKLSEGSGVVLLCQSLHSCDDLGSRKLAASGDLQQGISLGDGS